MKDVSTTVEYKGKKYKLVFNINVMETIQDKYGSLEKWGKLCEPRKTEDGEMIESNFKALKFGICEMLNEGVDIDNEENGTNDPPLTLKQIGRMITEFGTAETFETLNTTILKCTKNTEKNGSSTKSQ